jgi:hypothetical protein
MTRDERWSRIMLSGAACILALVTIALVSEAIEPSPNAVSIMDEVARGRWIAQKVALERRVAVAIGLGGLLTQFVAYAFVLTGRTTLGMALSAYALTLVMGGLSWWQFHARPFWPRGALVGVGWGLWSVWAWWLPKLIWHGRDR